MLPNTPYLSSSLAEMSSVGSLPPVSASDSRLRGPAPVTPEAPTPPIWGILPSLLLRFRHPRRASSCSSTPSWAPFRPLSHPSASKPRTIRPVWGIEPQEGAAKFISPSEGRESSFAFSIDNSQIRGFGLLGTLCYTLNRKRHRQPW